MTRSRHHIRYIVSALILLAATFAYSDEQFDKLIEAKKYTEALAYAEKNIPTTARDAATWVKVGRANLETGLTEKALACYLVATRMDAKNYEAYLGIAKVYNSLNQPAQAAPMAKKALEVNFTADASWEYARACIALGKPAEAKKALEKVVEADPSNITAVKELGVILYNEKNYPKAVELLKMVYAKQPDPVLALKIGEVSPPESAVVYLKLAKEKKPTSVDASFDLAKIYYNEQKFGEAAAEFEEASSKPQFGAQEYYMWATALSKSNADPEKIAKAYQLFLDKVGPSKAKEVLDAHKVVGTYQLDKKNYQAAVVHFEAIDAIDSTGKIVPGINVLLARCYEGLDVPKKAMVYLERELEVNSTDVEAYARLGEMYTKAGMLEKAKVVYEKMLALNPNNPKIQLALGDYNLKAKKYQDAAKYFQKSYTLERSAPAAQGMAMAAYELNQPDMARDAAESALHLDATLWEPRVILSSIYMKDKNYKEAKDQFEFMVRKQPNNKEYWEQLAICYEQLNEPARLAEIDRKILALEPRNIQSRQRLARYTLSQGDTKAALEEFKELAQLSPRDAEIFRNLYDIAMKMNNTTEAAGYLRSYVAIKPGDAAAQKALGDLLYEKKEMAGALAAYRAVVKIDPAAKGVYKRYAELLGPNAEPAELTAALTGAVTTGEADAQTYASLGSLYLKQGFCPKAIEMFQKSIQLDPRNTAVLSMLAHCQAKTGNAKEAIVSYEQAIAMNDKAVDELKALGDLYQQQNKTAQAVGVYKRYLAKKPGEYRIAKLVADYEFGQKDYEEANKYYAMVGGAEAKDGELMFKYGQSCYYAKNFKKAKELLAQVAVLNPKNAEVYRLLFDITSKDSTERTEASQYLQRYAALKPGDAEAQKNLGDMMYDIKNYSGALAAYRAALTADPSLKGFYKRYVELVGAQGTPEELVKALTGAINANEADAAMYSSLGNVYQKQAAWAKAIEMYQKSMQLDPKNVAVLSSMAFCQAKSGNVNEAVISYEQAVAMNDKAVDEYKALGDLYMQQKKTNQAVAVYKKFLAKKPGNRSIAKTIADYEYSQKNYDEAIKYFALVTTAETTDTDLLFRYGQACYSVKDYKKAKELYVRLAALTPKNPDVFRTLYDIASKDGSPKTESASYLQKYAALKPSDAATQKDLGDMMYEAKNYAGALAAYRAALAADPTLKGFYKRYVELVGAQGTSEELVKALTGAVAAGEADAAMYSSLGNVYQRQGAYPKAIDMYQKALQFDPRNIAILTALASCQAKSGNVNEAVISYEQAVAMNDKAVDEYKALGELYGKQNKTSQAVAMYKKYLEKKPTDFAIAKSVGDYSLSQKNYDDAIKYYGMVGGAEAKNADFLFKYGQACYFAKNYKKAIEVLTRLTVLTPANADIYKMMYDITNESGGAKTDAAAYLKKYVALRPGDAAAQKNLGDLLYEQKNFEGALAAYQAALKADPEIKGFYKRYVEIVTTLGLTKEIFPAMRGAIAAGEADAQMYETMGNTNAKSGACAKAIEYYQKALQLDPKRVKILSSLAQCQAKMGNTNEAVISYEQAVAMNPDAAEEYRVLGDLYEQQNKTSQAISMYKKYLEKRPQNSKIALIVGDYLNNQKNYEEAMKYFGMVSGAEAGSADFLFKYSQACYNAKNFKKASEVLLALAKLTPLNPEVFRMLYDISSKEGGNKKDASVYLKKYLSLKPADAAAQKNLGDILYEEKNADGALAAYNAALLADPSAKGFYKRYVELVTAKGVQADIVKALKGAIAAGEADAAMYMTLGGVYKNAANYSKAIEMYTKALQLDPRNNEALSALGFCQAKSGNVKEATITYEQVVALNPSDIKEYKMLADLYSKQNKNDQAMNMYKKVLEKNPNDTKTAMAVGEYEYKAKDYDEAVKYLAMVQGPEAKTASYLLLYGQACYKSRNCTKAADIFKELAVLTPTNPDVFKTLYDIAVKAGNNADAALYLKKYVALNPADAAAQKNLGDMLYEQKEMTGALTAYRAALKADPAIKGFYKRYVELVMSKGLPEEVGKALAGAVAAGEADATMYASLGAIYQKQGSYAKAGAMYQKALALDPKNVSVLSSLAQCQAKNGEVNEAVISYEQSIAMNPDATADYKALGELYTKQNKASQALSMYKKYLEKNPKDVTVAKSVGEAAFNAKNYDEAVKYLAMVTGEASRTMDFIFTYGQACYYTKDYKKTIELFERFRELNTKATEKNPGVVTVMKLLADSYDKTGNAAKALEAYTVYTKFTSVHDADASLRKAQLTEATNPAAAARMYEENTVNFPRDYKSFLAAGLYYAKQKATLDKALTLLKKCSALADTIPAMWYEMGQVYGKLGKDKEELDAYRKFIQLDPQNADAAGKIGELLLSKHKVNDAMVFLEMANSLKPNDPAFMVPLAQGYIETDRSREATDLLEKADRLKPDDENIKMTLFELYKSTGQSKKALDVMSAIVQKKRDNKTLLKYAEALYLAGVYAQAESTIKDITATDPENIPALMLYGKIQSIQGKWDDAVETYKEISYINPNYAPAMYERAEVYLMQSKLPWAKTFYDRALKADPNYALAELGLAKLAKVQKNMADYQLHLDKALKLDPNNKEILEESGKKKK
ncbi:MAG TPA: tetratricopeptide repeat protein [Chitinivibrionales bacterium]|nr:tetratricopeptide repeat protein [Chitinivibrionales bacterium]